MLSLVLAGETIFMPVFYLNRYFKSSLLGTLRIDERQLGELFAWYGAVAMACYLLGGPLADRVSPRKLLAGSLLATGAGGVYLSTLPGFAELRWLFAFWGASTIFAFWAPLIRATRELGGDDAQGKAFGLLDGGRGLAAVVVAFLSLRGCLAWLGADALADPLKEVEAVRGLCLFYAACCAGAAVLVWLLVPDFENASQPVAVEPAEAFPLLDRVLAVVRMPAIWLQALIVVAAYSTFKAIDYYGLFCEDAHGLSKTQSASLVAWLNLLRIGAALAAGWIADRLLGAAGTILACFAALLLAYGVLLALPNTGGLYATAVAAMAASCLAFFGLRGVYFALFEEIRLPDHLTGTAVGVVSFIGFTPEVFMPVVMGELIDAARKSGDVLVGYQQLFGLLAAVSVGGGIAAWQLRRRTGSVASDGHKT